MVSEEQKEILKERLKKARIAKIEKKNQIKEINKDKPVVETKSTEEKVVIEEPIVPIQPVETPPPAPKLKPKPEPREPKADPKQKQKYAKLVFYTEPNGRKLKKLSNLMSNDDSDSDAEQPPPNKVVPKSRKEIEQDEMIDKMNKETERANRLRNLALHFFN